MQFHIEQKFLCPYCNQIVPVLFESTGEVTVWDAGISDENGSLAERQFKHLTTCDACDKSFYAFLRVRYYHNNDKATIYDVGKVVTQEIGVEFARPNSIG